MSWTDSKPAVGARAQIPALRRKAIQALGSPREGNAIGSLRADAVVALLAGDADRAIARLSRAVEAVPRNPILWSDLAAARLQRGAAFFDSYDFFLALVAANRAFHLNPNLPAIRFNRALALQRLSLYDRAREGWELTLATERDPSWLNAARLHLASLEQSVSRPAPKVRLEAVEQAVQRGDRTRVRALVVSSPQVFREHVQGNLLIAWAEAEAAHRDAEARRLLAIARAIGEALAANHGERMAAETIAQLDGQEKNPQSRALLIQALRAYGRGVSLAKQGNFAGALPPLQTARQLLGTQHSPFAGWANYWVAFCRYQHSDYAAALDLLRPLTQTPYRTRYAALYGRALSLEGLILGIQGDPTGALTAYEAALDAFRGLEETVYAVRSAAMVAASLDFLGRRSDAWRQLHPVLNEPTTLKVPEARELVCVIAAWLANEEGEREIALWFQDEVVQSAMQTKAPYRIVEALRGRVEILAALGNADAAARDLEQAERYLEKVTDLDSREILEGDLKLAEARLADSPQEALVLLDDVIRIFRSSSYHYRLGQALYARSRARDALGRSSDADRDLSAAITEFELQREKITAPEERIAYFDRTREILDAMIRLQLERRHRPGIAFRYSERAKARVLLDWVLAQPAGRLAPEQAQEAGPAATDPASLQQYLPPGTTIVEYWVLRRNAFATEIVPMDGKALESLVHRLARKLNAGRKDEFLKTSAMLYERLIRPVEQHLPPGDRVVAVPDGALNGLPFSLLRNGRTGKYLIQDRIFSIAPSTRILIASLRRDQELASGRDPRLLVIADPAFDRKLAPSLVRLKSSRIEQRFVGLFPGSRVLSDRTATRRAFLESAGGFDIFHFGGHSLVNAEYPLLSRMLFAGEPGDRARGVLYSGDVLGRRFERTRLAVLASCSTAAGRISRIEGAESLARPFLAAGIPAVAASLWDVDDEVTAEFFSRFYGHFQQTFDPAAALQRAQIESLESESDEVADPRAWGAFQLIGGNVPEK